MNQTSPDKTQNWQTLFNAVLALSTLQGYRRRVLTDARGNRVWNWIWRKEESRAESALAALLLFVLKRHLEKVHPRRIWSKMFVLDNLGLGFRIADADGSCDSEGFPRIGLEPFILEYKDGATPVEADFQAAALRDEDETNEIRPGVVKITSEPGDWWLKLISAALEGKLHPTN